MKTDLHMWIRLFLFMKEKTTVFAGRTGELQQKGSFGCR